MGDHPATTGEVFPVTDGQHSRAIEGTLRSRSWAVRPRFDPLDRDFWAYRNVTVIENGLVDYVEGLERWVRTLDAAGSERTGP